MFKAIDALTWHHTIDLGNGIKTPGLWTDSAQAHITRLMDEADYVRKAVLDVGTLDGKWAFEAEKRGAGKVDAIDDIRQGARPETFLLAKDWLGSNAWYDPHCPVETVDAHDDRYDIIQFFGVYYHLRNPLLALAKLRKVILPDGVLLVEGEACNRPDSVAEFKYSEVHCGDTTTWFVPSVKCLCEWIESSCFDICTVEPQNTSEPYTRVCISAVPTTGHDPDFGSFDEDLAPFQGREASQ